MFISNLYAIVLYGSGFSCNRINGILKAAVDNSSMRMIDFLMKNMIIPLVPFPSEYCCHLSLLSTLLGSEISDKLNRQLADYPCTIVGSTVSKSTLTEDVLLIVCQSEKDSLNFFHKYINSLVEGYDGLQSLLLKGQLTL